MVTSSRFFLHAAVFALAILMGAASRADEETDPPGRVGRIAFMSGDVTLRNGDSNEWQQASLNWPITSHDVLWSGPGARAEIRIGSTILRLDSGTELEFVQLDDQMVRVWLHRGSIAVRLANRDMAREFELTTDHGHVVWMEPGRYRFDYADYTTTATASRGQLHFSGFGQTYSVGQGQSAEIWYSGTLDSRLTEVRHDEFFDWNLARDQREERRHGTRYVSTEMTGYEELDAYGDWRETSEYGAVWSPRLVPIGWGPYRHGRWALIAPWGWTWVDEQPWGFAPFHYGRWVYLGAQWSWVPGAYAAQPIYSPALVAWIGQSDSLQVVVGAPGVAWLPLGPREAYFPAYHSSTTYVRNINVSHVTNINNIVVNVPGHAPPIDYVNRRQPNAVTAVAADTLRFGRPVANAAVRNLDVRRLSTLPANQAPPLEAVPQRPFRAQPGERPNDRPSERNNERNNRPAPMVTMPQMAPPADVRGAAKPQDTQESRRIPVITLEKAPNPDAARSGMASRHAPETPQLTTPALLPTEVRRSAPREAGSEPKRSAGPAASPQAESTTPPEARPTWQRPAEKLRNAVPASAAAERKSAEPARADLPRAKRDDAPDGKPAGDHGKARSGATAHVEPTTVKGSAQAAEPPKEPGHRQQKKPPLEQPHQ